MNIYQTLKDAGVPLDNHESDLYAKVTPESTRIIAEYKQADTHARVSMFVSHLDGERWYDIPFAYTPWWDQRRAR